MGRIDKQRWGWAGLTALGALATGAYFFVLRPWHLRWGAAEDEVRRPMPSDDEVENPVLQATRAITIEAPASAIWPWLVQMGYGRAGWYAFDFIDNDGVPSAERIIPELQELEPGDRVPTGPGQSFTVRQLEPNRLLVLVMRSTTANLSVSIALRELGPETTRLVVRLRAWWKLNAREALYFLVFEPGDFLTMRKQLLGIKERAERSYLKEREAHPAASEVQPEVTSPASFVE